MTREQFDKARDVLIKIDAVDKEMANLREIISQTPKHWSLEIRQFDSYPATKIRHRGLLPKILDEIYDKMNEERDDLIKELEEI